MQGQATLFPPCAAFASAVSFIGFLLEYAGVGGLTFSYGLCFSAPCSSWACTCNSCASAIAWAAFSRRDFVGHASKAKFLHAFL